jgi:hypothetical protein
VCGTKRKRRKDEVEQERMCDAVARRLSNEKEIRRSQDRSGSWARA